ECNSRRCHAGGAWRDLSNAHNRMAFARSFVKMGEISLDHGCPVARRSPDRIENRASRSARTRVVQSVLVDRIDRNHRLNYHAHFWPNESPRTACFRWIELSHRWFVGDWRAAI